jgi:hypothetical protein
MPIDPHFPSVAARVSRFRKMRILSRRRRWAHCPNDMNPRRVHTLFKKHCPAIDLASCEWTHIIRDGALQRDLLQQLLATLETMDVLIHVRRKLGDFLPLDEAVDFVCENFGKSSIRITDRNFTRFVIVAQNGVAATWLIHMNWEAEAYAQAKF